ncbi:snare-complex protein syntaxin-18 N-terminus-domain-containing protein [Xylariomycetidae sp. FL0641]|nr:snare-complex protein syntaxin-18 N-terminus-domain-containing protein [Xylariomycetidae sp. FL0641]
MTDITPLFNGFLKQHEAAPTKRAFSLESLDDFLKEAYRINSHITSLHADLRNIRQSYLSTAQPRKTLIKSAQRDRQARPLSDREREEIDANAKKMLRELNASIRRLADVEQARTEIEHKLIQKKFVRGLGALGAWAAGGAVTSKSPEHQVAEDCVNTLSSHRDGVLWLLRHRLQECVQTQQEMMEIRISREMEKSRSVLAKSHTHDNSALRSLTGDHNMGTSMESAKPPAPQSLPADEPPSSNLTGDLTAEQVQMFEQDNQDMLKHYESTLDQVRTAEKSLIEISELQTQLIDTLTTQSAGIEQLVTDAENTTENVGGGNKQLKKATERASTARFTFLATCGLCTFLVVWDLIF